MNREVVKRRRQAWRNVRPEDFDMPADSVDPALWLGERVKHFKTLAEHPLLPQIHGRLIMNQSCYRIAYWIQDRVPKNDVLGSESKTISALVRLLYRYKKALPPASFLPQTYLDDILRKADIQVDVLSELATLVVYQKQRISQFAGREKDFPLGMTVEQQRKEVVTLADLLVRMRDTQIALGAVDGLLPNSVQMTQVNIHNTTVRDERPQDALSQHLQANPHDIPRVMAALDALKDIYGDDTTVDGEAVEVEE